VPNGTGSGWVDVASRAIVQVGFPVVVAGVLLWFLLTRFQDTLIDITTRMEKNANVVEAFTGELHVHTNELKEQTLSLKAIQEQSAQMLKLQEERIQLLRQERHP